MSKFKKTNQFGSLSYHRLKKLIYSVDIVRVISTLKVQQSSDQSRTTKKLISKL